MMHLRLEERLRTLRERREGFEGGGGGTHALAPFMKVTHGGRASPGLDCRRQMRGTLPSLTSCARVTVQQHAEANAC